MPIVVPSATLGPGSIVDYDSLLQAIADWIHRDDLNSFLATFVQLCESELYDMLLLKDMESDEALTLTTGNNYVALPSGFISPIAFWLTVDTVRVPIDFCLPEQLPYFTENTQPRMVAVDGANLRFDSPVDQNYAAHLRCLKSSNLSQSNTSNALLVRRPDVYLFGSLKHAALYLQDDNLMSKFVGPMGLFEVAVRQLKAANNRSKSVATLTTDFGSRGRSNIQIDE